MSNKNESALRREALKKLLNETLVSDQKTLVDLLKEKFNITTNQAVLSRDLRKLGVIKKEINQKLFYTLPSFDVVDELLRLAIVDIQYNEVMIVIKTYPGLADFVGDYVDQEPDLPILGCLAGENVVFIACQSIKNIHKTYEIICKYLNFKLNIS